MADHASPQQTTEEYNAEQFYRTQALADAIMRDLVEQSVTGSGLPCLSRINVKVLQRHLNDLREAAKGQLVVVNAAKGAIEEAETLRARVAELEAGLEPFAEFGRNNTDADEWGGLRCERERIYVWFGPSEFRTARALLEKDSDNG